MLHHSAHVKRGQRIFVHGLSGSVDWLKTDKITVPVKATFKLEEVQAAHREYASSNGIGSIILEVSPSVIPNSA